ncbi:MAG: Ribosomal RNA large subunit methyltransferase K [Firmicutes bacterium ADurb.Bin300]|nr:MAG: Ribosomal RNA large subunit methyltransferase K [Firmicutes bacterium ADurb.Bin300]HOD02132.1 class I SAM-dependent methyltransferase [Clostridiales bacterium]
MRVSCQWKDYELLDCTLGERLERWGDIILIRPDPQVIWKSSRKNSLWENPHGRYIRSDSGAGAWHFYRKTPESWEIKYRDLTFRIKPTGFKHTGLFPEQAVNWDLIRDIITGRKEQVRVLNLFAYTGAASISSLKAGAHTVHVDAAKGMVSWAKENAALSGASDKNVRWIVDDCKKFVAREIRRGSKYDIIIMDPPSYGRGPGKEIWKIEDEVYELVNLCVGVLSDKPLAFLINSYTAGLSPCTLGYILNDVIYEKFGGNVFADEIGIKVSSSGLTLPCGGAAVWRSI